MAGTRQLQFGLMLQAVEQGTSGAALLRELRAEGIGMRTQDFYRLFGQAAAVVREAGAEPFRPVDQVPTLAESPPVPASLRAEPGVIQTVRLVYREKVTGNFRVVYHSTKTAEGITRQAAVDAAIDAYEAHSQEYQTTLYAAVHTSAIRITPVAGFG